MNHELNTVARLHDVEVLQSRADLLPEHDRLAGIRLKSFHDVCNAFVAETGALDPVAEKRNAVARQKAPCLRVVFKVVERNEALQQDGRARLRNSECRG